MSDRQKDARPTVGMSFFRPSEFAAQTDILIRIS